MPPVLGDGVIYDSLLNGWTGGVSFNGTVFELRPPSSTGGAWTRQLLHAFSGSDGMAPLGGIVVSGGVLYGATQRGGTSGSGTLFSLTPRRPSVQTGRRTARQIDGINIT
jgi:uncharacterized repeat protein (TIGR03803 family)